MIDETLSFDHFLASNRLIDEMREHIDFCFTCIAKTLPIEQQVALLLKDVYGFKVKEAALIMDKSIGVVQHLLHYARRVMTDIFDARCSLVSKNGVCYQCSELNGLFNPKQKTQEELMKLELVSAAANVQGYFYFWIHPFQFVHLTNLPYNYSL